MHFSNVLFRHPHLWAGRCPRNAGKAAAAVSFSSQGMCSCHRAPLTSVTACWGRPNPKNSWWPLHHHPCSSWAMTGRTVLSCSFPGWLKDQQGLSPWGQGCKSSKEQQQGAQAFCRHAACLCAAPWSCSVAEFFGCFHVPGEDCEASEGTAVH